MIENWKTFPLSELFVVDYGNKFDLYKMQETDITEIAFVSRTATNNGVSSYVEKIEGTKPYSAGYLTIALGGSIGSTFVQSKPFYTGQNVAVLIPKVEMSNLVKLFIATIIKKESDIRFVAFGRELNKHIKTDFTLKLPQNEHGKPDYGYMHDFMENLNICIPITTKNKTENTLPLDKLAWEEFPITRLFNINRGKMGSVTSCESGNIPLVTAYTQNNGVSNYISCENEYMHNGNCLTVANTGQGSVFRTFYQPSKFIPSNNVTCLTAKGFTLNKYIGLFITTLCWLEIPRYSYGRIVNNTRLEQTVLKLPVKKANKGKSVPDWDYMENYIKSLPYGDRI